VRHGAREDVRNSLHANATTESFSGLASVHHQTKADALREFRERENDPNVLRWVDEELAVLEERIRVDRITEEREGF
jgi:hypothetical protein